MSPSSLTCRKDDVPPAFGHRRLAGRIVIATHNPGKLREMRELLAPFGIEAVSAGELGLAVPASLRASADEMIE